MKSPSPSPPPATPPPPVPVPVPAPKLPSQPDGPLSLLHSVWAASDRLFDHDVTQARALHIPISLRMPFLFYMGHLPAFASNKLLNSSPDCQNAKYDDMFSRGIDPDVDDPSKCHNHPVAPPVWPSWSSVTHYRDTVRTHVQSLLVSLRPPLLRDVRMVAEHEAMHIETLQYMLAQTARKRPIESCCSGGKGKNGKVLLSDVDMTECTARELEWCHVKQGDVVRGTPVNESDESQFVWDNETDLSVTSVPPFDLSKYAVPVKDMVTFIRANGYDTRRWWDEEDWAWLCSHGLRHPHTWECCLAEDGKPGWNILTIPGAPHCSSVPDFPVSVSLAEASAYARWLSSVDVEGCKYTLPTEHQWLRAAYQNPSAGDANISMRKIAVSTRQEMHTAHCGAVNMIGNGWELTTSPFERYKTFKAMKEYPEYSADFFDGKHFVLKGASWATDSILIRKSFRNFYQRRYPYVFSQFRLVASSPGG